jgi:aspartyl-tRNA(Asn)/glutamyl-tRNA(Gln) amidotransferase subunit A
VELRQLSARELLEGFREQRFTPSDAVEACAEQIEAVDATVCAFTTQCLDRAREEARSWTSAYTRGDTTAPLGGVPFAAKDLFDSAGVRTTYGSPLFLDHVPNEDAEAIRRVRAAGGILIGKAQTHEFAWGITSVNPHLGSTRNPWALDRVSGGSSGGSAVALAAEEVPLALGSDTGGSIRVPSALCGIIGLKPTFGRISAAGVLPLARTLDHPGPLARTPADIALLLQVLAGVDPNDPATEDVPLGDVEGALTAGIAGMRIALCPSLHLVPLAPDVAAVWDAAVAVVCTLGATLVEAELPGAERIYETFGTIQRAEALFTHEQRGLFPAQADAYGADVRGRLEAATRVTLSDYLAASAERERIGAAFARLFRDADLLLTPVGAGSPVPIGDETTMHLGREIEFRELVMSYTVPQDITGLPACAVRAGFDELGIPVGVQFTGPPWQEARVLQAVSAFHDATAELQVRRPPIASRLS